MNKTLFLSGYAVIATALVAAFYGWYAAKGMSTTYLLWSGWSAFALMIIVTLYSLRKYMHQLGISPEMRHPPALANLEKAESRMNELRQQILKGSVTAKSDVEKLARNILKEEGVEKTVRIEVEKGPAGSSPFVVRAFPTEPFGRVAKWLHAHIYLGLASGALVWLHGEGSWDSFLGTAMNGLTVLVILTGIVGAFLFALGPAWISRNEKDLTFEESFILNQILQGKLDDVYSSLDPESLALFRAAAKSGSDFDQKAKQVSESLSQKDPASKSALQDVLVLLGQQHKISQNYQRLSRIRFWMNAWRAVHVPASIVLLGTVVIHIVAVWWY